LTLHIDDIVSCQLLIIGDTRVTGGNLL
jgi:hypothetical protein